MTGFRGQRDPPIFDRRQPEAYGRKAIPAREVFTAKSLAASSTAKKRWAGDGAATAVPDLTVADSRSARCTHQGNAAVGSAIPLMYKAGCGDVLRQQA